MKVFIPPIKCQGIKSKLTPWILETMQWERDGRWIEPFMGSGVVGFNVRPARAIFSDTNPHLINFYNALNSKKITPQIIREYLEHEGSILSVKGQEYYYEVRERFNASGTSLDFLFLNRCCFNGVIRFNRKGGFNVPFGHKPLRFSKAYVTKIVNQSAYVSRLFSQSDYQFLCQDFEKTLSSVDDGDFIYCDPPYVGRHTDYYNGWNDTEEGRLYRALSTTPTPFILSTWHGNEHRDNVYIDAFWSRFSIHTKAHHYHVGAREINRKPMLEALVCNYTLAKKAEQTSGAQQVAFDLLALA